MNFDQNIIENIQFTQLKLDFTGKIGIGATKDNLLRFFKVENEKFVNMSELDGHTGVITCIDFVEDGKYAVSADFNGMLIVWIVENGKIYKKFEKQLKQGSPIYDISTLLTPEGFIIFCGCEKGEIVTVDYANNAIQNTVVCKTGEDALSQIDVNGDFLISSTINNEIMLTPICSNKLLDTNRIFSFKKEISDVKITRKNCFEKFYLAISFFSGDVFIYEWIKDEFREIANFNLDGSVWGLCWAYGGFSLSALYGEENDVKVFELNEKGVFDETNLK